ncbi:MAG: CBS domain-containing protein [Xanthomonadales bacterium]|nr:CBS domain-containing protein [Xanthomonadales bacterium]
MKHLTLYSLGEISQVASPAFEPNMDLTAPATSVFTDFSIYHPFDLSHETLARQAIYLMQVAHVRLKFVVDDNDQFLGVVTTQELNNQEIIKKVAQGFTEDELTVAEFMKHKSELSAISYEDLLQANIGDVLQILKSIASQHCLVINQSSQKIQGIISSSDIARSLRVPHDMMNTPDFVDVFKVIRPDYLDKQMDHLRSTLS